MKLASTDALLLIDLQTDFMPGGKLEVAHGDEVIPVINKLARHFDHVLLTQDWHPPQHISFASTHPGRGAYDEIDAPYGKQALWPDHCLQHSAGAELDLRLDIPHAELILRKGFRRDVDSYSAFFENDHTTPTGLAGYLRERGLKRIFLAGLAYDFCVRYSALDGKAQGFEVIVLADATRAVAIPGSIEQTQTALQLANVPELQTTTLTR